MKQKELSRWLRSVVIVGWCACGLLSFAVAPYLAYDAVLLAPELAPLKWPCLILFWVAMAVVVVALWHGWKIFGEIGRDNSFCAENARRLRLISRLALTDTLLCLVPIVLLLFFHGLHPGVFLLLMLIAAVGAGITVAAAALSHLTMKAAAIQDENDLTV